MKKIIFLSFLIGYALTLLSQDNSFGLNVKISVPEENRSSFIPSGRLFLFLNQDPRGEPRRQTWPDKSNIIFAKNISDWNANEILEINDSEGWVKTPDWSLDNIPGGVYYLQMLWDQDTEESRINAPGTIYSVKQKITLNTTIDTEVVLERIIPERKVAEHDLVRKIQLKSDTLSKWWGKPVNIKASILLPGNYGNNPDQAYPIRYNVAGYGGRYTRVNELVYNVSFMNWWQSDDAPRIINVFLDGEGPFGDSYQMDSDNSGPYGYSLINELIPYIEGEFRGTDTPDTRFVDGCSTGGWVSLGLQLYYPDVFNGAFSYSPDAIEFENYQLINIYKDKNAYINEFGYLRPVVRDVDGEPIMSVKEFIHYENVLGSSNTYLNSGGQFSAHIALYSPKGNKGLPRPLFDPFTGEIDTLVADSWKKYDFKIHAEENWTTLGPKLQGKIYIWMGDMDHFYLNLATRAFDDFLKTTTNPVSDAEVIFSPTEGHCSQYSHRAVLEKIMERIE